LGVLYASGSHPVVYTLPPRAENPCIGEIERAVQHGLTNITCTSNGVVFR
jgi:hypothetical protein